LNGSPIESFFVALGFKVDDEGLQSFESHLKTARNAALAFGAVAVTAAAGLAAFTVHVAESIDNLGDWADQENVAIEAVQELGHAAQLSGSSIDAIKSSVGGLNRVTGEAVIGIGRGAKIFEKLGLEAKGADGKVKSFDTLLGEIAEKMQGLSRQEQIAMSEKLGIDRSLIPLLQKGKEGIAALREEARAFGIVSEKDAKEAGMFQDSMDRMLFLFKAIKEQIAIKLMPSLRGLIDNFRTWIMVNKDFIGLAIDRVLSVITGTVSFLGDWIMRLINVGMSLFNVTKFLISGFMDMNIALQAAGVAMLLFWARALLVPVALAAISAAILLIVDDMVNWADGNDSVIGQILSKYPEIAMQVYAVAAAAMAVKDAFVQVGVWIGESIAKVVMFVEKAQSLFSLGFGGGASMRLPTLPSFGGNPSYSQASSGNNSLNSKGGVVGNVGSNGINSKGGVIGGAGSNSTSSTVNHSTTHQNNTIHIKSSDPVKAGQEVQKAMGNINRNAARNHKSQVAQ